MRAAGILISKLFLAIAAIGIALGTAVVVSCFQFGEPLFRRVKVGVAPVVGVRTGFVIARPSQMRILCGPIRKFAGLVV